MTLPKLQVPPPRIALTRPEAAAAVGVSTTTFDEHFAPQLAAIRRGRLTLYPVAELERLVLELAEPVLPTAGVR